MNPKEFLDLAETLAGEGALPAPRLRSAASRAYYAALLDARERLNRVEHVARQLRRGRNRVHEVVWNSLQRGAPTLAPIGRTGFSLKRLREAADYDLSTPFTATDVTEALRLAKRICAALEAADLLQAADESGSPPSS